MSYDQQLADALREIEGLKKELATEKQKHAHDVWALQEALDELRSALAKQAEGTVRECVEIAKNMPIWGLGKAGADRVAGAILSHFHLEK